MRLPYLFAASLMLTLSACQTVDRATARGDLASAVAYIRHGTRAELASRPPVEAGVRWFARHDGFRMVAFRGWSGAELQTTGGGRGRGVARA